VASRTEAALYIPFEVSEPLPLTSPIRHYHVSHDRKFKLNVTNWLVQNHGDPSTQVEYA
jgi:hypothetical protein